MRSKTTFVLITYVFVGLNAGMSVLVSPEKKLKLIPWVEDGTMGVVIVSSGAVGHCSSIDCFA